MKSPDAFDIAIAKYQRSEARFKHNISLAMIDAHIDHVWERRVARASGETTRPWSIFVDLRSSPSANWFVECKIKADVSSCAKALGQAIIYRQLVSFKHAILCFPERELYDREFYGEFELVCERNQILLTHENNIIETIKSL